MIEYESLIKILKVQNLLTALISSILLLTACLFQWHIVSNFRLIKELVSIFNLSQTMANITIIIIIYSVSSIFYGIFGLISLKFLNKKFFIINTICLCMFILANIVFLILYLVLIPNYEMQIRNGQLIQIKQPSSLWNFFDASFLSNLNGVHNHCTYLVDVNLQYNCCSALEPGDLSDPVKLECCIKPNPKNACITMLLKELSFYFNRLVGVPGCPVSPSNLKTKIFSKVTKSLESLPQEFKISTIFTSKPPIYAKNDIEFNDLITYY
ncbi:hypothetical protein BpHYR1_044024 [Brachionus plicatilis]|uniref:Uncharacterized protein n=1 Tax=Brachionus plicatilis TaxID=10195 RepID=A0A3M7SHT1_BRAPC|nr:hypothetical protein BpHYR1_044024 [Brachionus plicatilis]